MFDTLSDRLGSVFDRLRGRGALSESDVRAAMREVRVALLEADVALPVAREFVEQVTEKAVGAEVLRSVTPGQMWSAGPRRVDRDAWQRNRGAQHLRALRPQSS